MKIFTRFKPLLFVAALLTTISAYGQIDDNVQGNEWIVPGQVYYKVSVAQPGIYRLTKEVLEQAGFPVGAAANRIQIWRRGQQVARLVTDANRNGRLDNGDYVEFWGDKNDGTTDSRLYKKPAYQFSTASNLFTDSAAYFITASLVSNGISMEEYNQTITTAYNAAFVYGNQKFTYNSEYSPGLGYYNNQSEVHQSYYDWAEGWVGSAIFKAGTTFTFPNIKGVAPGADSAEISFTMVGRYTEPMNVEMYIGTGNTAPTLVSTFRIGKQSGWDWIKYTKKVSAFYMQTGTFSLNFKSTGIRGNQSPVSLSDLSITWPKSTNLANETVNSFIKLKATAPNNNAVFSVTNALSGTRIFDVSNPARPRWLTCAGSNCFSTAFTVNVKNTADTARSLYVAVNPANIPLAGLKKVNFRSLNNTRGNFLIVSHKVLHAPALMGSTMVDAVRTYTEYRASEKGGGFDTVVLDVDDAYNLFNYGDKAPVAIRRFVKYMMPANPTHLFLLGKAVDLSNQRLSGIPDLVPTWGYPQSDIYYSNEGIGNTKLEPALSTARLAAQNPQHILDYLGKVKEFESANFDDLWHKQLLHCSGGKSDTELRQFNTYVSKYKGIAEGKYLGGKATVLNKQTTDYVAFLDITKYINAGLSTITLFGHSTSIATDIELPSISDPTFNNKGKYPLMIVNGCYAGWTSRNNNSSTTINETYVLTKDKGAIAYMGNVDLGFPTWLDRFITNFYNTQFGDSVYINKSIGEAYRVTISKFLTPAVAGAKPTLYDSINAEQFNIHGDPAICMFPVTKPDYYAVNAFVATPNVNTYTPTFNIGVVIRNLGRVIDDSLQVAVRRTLADGTTIMYGPYKYPSTRYVDSLYIPVNSTRLDASGNNRFEVLVDYENLIPEVSETNNIAAVDYGFASSGVLALFPKKYSIVSDKEVTFVGQSLSNVAGNQSYIFQVDTSENFKAPLLQQRITAGTVPSFSTTLPFTLNETVYYWRSRLAEPKPNTNDTAWSRSSFVYIGGSKPGWSQTRYPQYSESVDKQVHKNSSTRQYDFDLSSLNLRIKTGENGNSQIYFNDILMTENRQNSCYLEPNSIVGTVLDHRNLSPKLYTYAPQNYQYSCGREPFAVNFFRNTDVNSTSQMLGGPTNYSYLSRMYENVAQLGDFIILTNMGAVSMQNWNAKYRDSLWDMGIDTSLFNKLKNGDPFIIVGQKGIRALSKPNEHKGFIVIPDYSNTTGVAPAAQRLDFPGLDAGGTPKNFALTGSQFDGSISAPRVGPASSWQDVLFNITTRDNNAADKYSLDLYKVKLNGESSLYIRNVESGRNISDLDATQYPYLQLVVNVKDTVNFTPPAIKMLRVHYEGVPEGLVDAGTEGFATISTKQQGETFNYKLVFRNISPRAFKDTLVTRITLKNTSTGRVKTWDMRSNKILTASGTVNGIDTINITNIRTDSMAGENRFQVFVNPQLQAEEYYTNNVIDLPFNIEADKYNPQLDVTFDGVRIMNEDIVSPSPLIGMQLKDENKYLLKKDTAGVLVYLRKPGDNETYVHIPFSNELKFYPATATQPVRVEFTPKNLPNGTYGLKVNAPDAQGNTSGGLAYEVNFRVVNESTISNFYPYPNPFSSSTRFVFTLTGATVPDQLKIQIMTVTGKVVREITRSELGNLRIGNNITSFAWNGTDEYGDKLANGVYLYRVLVRKNGQDFEHFATANDALFKNGIGKMYLMR